ncbi:hypothetical protein [Sulfitobacter sp.]|uniref:hypothetical protein n=1 Tax=Sulfitobacter sp. TaxID=1903071 RepID=UPI0032976C64
MRITFDWNCIIEVEEGRSQAGSVRKLVEHHRMGNVEVALLAASASENTPSTDLSGGRKFPGSALLFKERVDSLGWGDLPIVLMPAVFGLSYWDYCYFVGDGDAFESDIDALWAVIAPKVPRKPKDFLPAGEEMNDEMVQSPQLAKWRNTWCDVISAYSHINDGRDVFITRNTKDFQKKSEALAELGMRDIADPNEMLKRIVGSQHYD